jgi:anti-sigma factor RsiW
MTRCLDEAKLQCYFDGELSIHEMESATSHLASCVTCAAAARELEQELALLTTALSGEFEASVPTERLRQRIDAAVLGERIAAARATEKTSGLAGFVAGLLNFQTQRTLGYAGLVVVMAFAAILGVVYMRTDPKPIATTQPAVGNQPGKAVVAQLSTPVTSESPLPDKSTDVQRAPQVVQPRSFRPIKVAAKSAPIPAPVKLMPGERSYLQTIARLDSTIESGKKDMRPSLRVEYERNLAVVDRAIAATRTAAKSNPNDPDAADFMFAAYQSKVDLLNTIADARVGGGRGH